MISSLNWISEDCHQASLLLPKLIKEYKSTDLKRFANLIFLTSKSVFIIEFTALCQLKQNVHAF